MKIAKYTSTQLKLVHRPWVIWSLAGFSWIAGCFCLISPPSSGSGLTVLLLLLFSLLLVSLYPIVVCEISKSHDTLAIRQYGFLGQRVAEYPLHMVLAVELSEGQNRQGNSFYKIRFAIKSKHVYLSAAPIENAQQAQAIASLTSEFLDIPLHVFNLRSPILHSLPR